MAKAPLEIRSLARAHTRAAIRVLKSIMNQDEAPAAARVAAAQYLIDRGWGKAPQVIAGDEENPLRIIGLIERVITEPQLTNGVTVIEHENGPNTNGARVNDAKPME